MGVLITHALLSPNDNTTNNPLRDQKFHRLTNGEAGITPSQTVCKTATFGAYLLMVTTS